MNEIKKSKLYCDRNKWVCVLQDPNTKTYRVKVLTGGSEAIVQNKIAKQLHYWIDDPYKPAPPVITNLEFDRLSF